MDKFITVDEAVAKIKSGMTLMIGGFLAAGTPNKIVEALSKTDVKDLTIIANDTAFPDRGIGLLITNKQVKKVIASHIGTNPNTVQQLNDKELIVEFSPPGGLLRLCRQELGEGLHLALGVALLKQPDQRVDRQEIDRQRFRYRWRPAEGRPCGAAAQTPGRLLVWRQTLRIQLLESLDARPYGI